MRTTVTLDRDVAAAVRKLRRERGLGMSEAVNQLARAGLTVRSGREPFGQRSARLALKIDVTNVAEAIEQLDGPTER
jgi:hypothetical protein